MTAAEDDPVTAPAGPPGPDPRALLGHDLRAAVSDVVGGLRLIDAAILPDAARAQVERVRAASELLARLVEEMTDAPLAGAARAGADLGHTRLGAFLSDEARRWQGQGGAGGPRVTLARGEGLPDLLPFDDLPLRRAVANLMANALRHARGAVELRAAVAPDGALVLAVRDDGPGFGPDPDRLRGVGRSGAASTGMGLHIAAAHAEGLGGHLRLRDHDGGGAEAAIVLPPEAWAAPAPPRLPDLSGWRVLVADDSETNQRLLVSILAPMGAACAVAGDGIEALDLLSRERFDLAVIDVEMPSLGGLEVIRSERLRQARGLAPPTPLIAMTAYALRDARAAIEAAGAEGILQKPIGTPEEVGAILAPHAAERRAAEWAPDAAPPINAALLAELIAGAGAGFLDGLKADLAAAAGRLDAARAAGDDEALAAEAHALMSLAGVVGALPTRAAARAAVDGEPGATERLVEHLAVLRALLGAAS